MVLFKMILRTILCNDVLQSWSDIAFHRNKLLRWSPISLNSIGALRLLNWWQETLVRRKWGYPLVFVYRAHSLLYLYFKIKLFLKCKSVQSFPGLRISFHFGQEFFRFNHSDDSSYWFAFDWYYASSVVQHISEANNSSFAEGADFQVKRILFFPPTEIRARNIRLFLKWSVLTAIVVVNVCDWNPTFNEFLSCGMTHLKCFVCSYLSPQHLEFPFSYDVNMSWILILKEQNMINVQGFVRTASNQVSKLI